MAVIGNIRKHSGLLLGVVGVAMVLFIAGDFLTSGSIFLNGQNNEIGEIDGKSFSAADFELRVQQYVARNYPGQESNSQARSQARDYVWNQMVREEIVLSQYDALGIYVTDEEIVALIKTNPNHRSLRQYFTDPNTRNLYEQFVDPATGGLSSNAVLNYLQSTVYSGAEEAGPQRAGWEAFQEQLRQQLMDEKYGKMVGAGLLGTTIEAETQAIEQTTKYGVKYVSKLFSSVPDTTVSYTDADLKAYYEDHKNEAEYEELSANRSIDYVVWEVMATADDEKNAFLELDELKSAFANSEDDTTFVQENSDTPFNFRWTGSGSFPAENDSIIMAATDGFIVGPFKNDSRWEMVKVKGRKTSPDSVRTSHILLQVANPADSASVQAQADSLLAAAKGGADFEAMVTEFSADKASAEKGGDIDWMTENSQIVPEYKAASFESATIDDIVLATSQFGIHIIKITDVTEPTEKVLVAIVDNMIEPSNKTFQEVYSEASSFSINENTAEKFNEKAASMGIMQANFITEDQDDVNNMENAQAIVRWMFESEIGSVSSVFELEDMYVVALLTDAREKGVQPFDAVKDQLVDPVLNIKKAEKLAAQVADKGSLEDIASTWGTIVQTENGLDFNNFDMGGIGVEPKVQGTMATLGQNDMSVVIDGNRGVYVLQVTQITEGNSESANKIGLTGQLRRRGDFGALNALQSKADITDNRFKYY